MARSNAFVIFFAFLIAFTSLPFYVESHTEYEEIGIYPQKEHSLTKPYQGTTTIGTGN